MTTPPRTCASCAHFRPATAPMLCPSRGQRIVLGDCTLSNHRLGAGVRADIDRCDAHSPKAP